MPGISVILMYDGIPDCLVEGLMLWKTAPSDTVLFRLFCRISVDKWFVFSDFVEVVEVDEMHDSENQHDDAQFGGRVFDAFCGIAGPLSIFQEQKDEAQVHQVKSHHQKMVDSFGQIFIAFKGVQEKQGPVLMQGAGNPDGHQDCQGEVDEVDPW